MRYVMYFRFCGWRRFHIMDEIGRIKDDAFNSPGDGTRGRSLPFPTVSCCLLQMSWEHAVIFAINVSEFLSSFFSVRATTELLLVICAVRLQFINTYVAFLETLVTIINGYCCESSTHVQACCLLQSATTYRYVQMWLLAIVRLLLSLRLGLLLFL